MKGLILLHGRGGSAADITGLIPALGASGLKVAAPEAADNSWWPTSFLAPSAQMEPWVERGLHAVETSLRDLALPRGEVALVGFSQGACLALEYAARRGIGGVVALSGGLVGTEDQGGADPALYGAAGKAFDYRTDLTGTRAVITCHAADPHIPIKRARDSADVLRRLGADARFIEHPGPGHHPMPDGLEAARAVLS
ncbi:alpha/beta hydrolase [Jannaschia aquimarina]|uniref:Alpha/beta hydrolase family protein n=1 Tax=Jannaschia aquimarina TaxID=935700 RepID=A0A0D1EKE6_9RHOB|nr:hypothetical protein [Jannaschia aquimarina]KIT17496.1 Alpha/beta hydrolase family protein [Jannaschia aquimarina]SNS74530.1 phospholipase/carboxylesterase [Jannaschia aquimarina]